MLLGFPLLLLALAAYNVIVFFTGLRLDDGLFDLQIVSGARWLFTVADLLLAVSLVLLFVEILKSTRTGASSIVDHMLSTMVFIGCLIEFLMVREAATSTFFLIMLMALIDVVAGYSVTIRAARRDFSVGPGDDPF